MHGDSQLAPAFRGSGIVAGRAQHHDDSGRSNTSRLFSGADHRARGRCDGGRRSPTRDAVAFPCPNGSQTEAEISLPPSGGQTDRSADAARGVRGSHLPDQHLHRDDPRVTAADGKRFVPLLRRPDCRASARGFCNCRRDGDTPQLFRAGRTAALRGTETDDLLLAQGHPLHHDPGNGRADRAPDSDHLRSFSAGRVRRSIDAAHGSGPPLLRDRPVGLFRHSDHRCSLLFPPGHEVSDEGRHRCSHRQRAVQRRTDVPAETRRTGTGHIHCHRRECRNALDHSPKAYRETSGSRFLHFPRSDVSGLCRHVGNYPPGRPDLSVGHGRTL